MDSREYAHMEKVYNYVFSVPPGAERNKRLSEISEEDNAKLYDFDMGLRSGRIKRPENQSKESEEGGMNKEKEITSYADFKAALCRTSNYHRLVEFKRNFPEIYKSYMERMERESCGNSAREV